MEEHQSIDDQFLDLVDRVIQENLDNEHFTVSNLADQVAISRSVLHRRLKRLTGKSATDLITEKRLQHARVLLEHDVATVSEIAYKVGFKSPSYFSKVFQKHFGEPPGALRKKAAHPHPDPVAPEEMTGINGEDHSPRRGSRVGWYITVPVILGLAALLVFYFTRSAAVQERSIAVLPLDNLTGSEDNDYFVDGLHDALIGELGQISSLRVISRTSTLRYRNSNMLLQDIAAELGVNTIVEGSVLTAGDSVRLLLQLIDVFPQERHIFSRDYRDEMQQVLTIQETAASEISQRVGVSLTRQERGALRQQRTVDPETYKDYLRGMYQLNQGTPESFEAGMQYLQQAIARDPGDPFAYAGLALGYAIRGHGDLSAQEAFARATSAADKALMLNPYQDEAHTALALLYLYDGWDWPLTKAAFESALSRNPNNEVAHAHFAWYFILFNDMEQSIEHAKKAVMIEPLSAAYQSWLAWLYFFDGQYDEAETWARKSVELQPDLTYGNLVLGWAYLRKKQYREAIATHEKLPDDIAGDYYRGYTYLKAGREEKARQLWEKLEATPEAAEKEPCYLGLMAAYMGEKDRAFPLLEQAFDRKMFPVTYIGVFPGAEYLSGDPRYDSLLQRMQLPYRKTIFPAP